MRHLVALAGTALLYGCATPGAELTADMQQLVGQPIQKAIALNGPPVNTFDAGQGRRAFQWDKSYQTTRGGGAVVIPTGYGGATVAKARTHTKNHTCFMTLYARGSGQDWTVESFEPPKC